jgi:hypothetical protein
VIYSARLVPMADAQRQAHDAARQQAERLVAGWQRSGYLADAQQWRLSERLQAMQQAAHRAEPGPADSPLADAVVQAIAAQLDDWTEGEPQPQWLLCASAADAAQLAERLGPRPGLAVLAPGDRPSGRARRVLQVGVPWRLLQQPLVGAEPDRSADDQAVPATGQHWVLVAAEHSLDIGLLDTLAARVNTPSGPAEPGGQGFLSGASLTAWLTAVAAALRALPA